MLIVLTIALITGVFAAWMQARMWRVPVALLPTSVFLRGMLSTAFVSWVIGVLARNLLRIAEIEELIATLVGSLIGACVGLSLAWISAQRSRWLKGFALLTRQIPDPDVSDRALDALMHLLAQLRNCDAKAHAALSLMAIPILTHCDHWQNARTILQNVELDVLEAHERAVHAQALATCALHFDDVTSAQTAIASIARPTRDPLESWINAIEGLLCALRGEADAAFEHVGRQAEENDEALRASHSVVRAHAWVTLGDTQAANVELERVRELAGTKGLQRVLRPAGPATPLAEALLRA